MNGEKDGLVPETTRKCLKCGRGLPAQARFCTGCGAALGPVGPGRRKPDGKGTRGPVIAAIAAAAVILLLVAGIVTLAILTNVTPKLEVPSTRAELEASVESARDYLSPEGRRLLGDRADGATVYGIDARLDTEKHTVSGRESVLFTNRTDRELSSVVFRVYANSPYLKEGRKTVTVSGATRDGNRVSVRVDGSLLTVDLGGGLPRGASTLLAFTFSEPVPSVSESMLPELEEPPGGYGIFGRRGENYDLGYWMPLVASFRNGAWDDREPSDMGDPADFDSAYFSVSFEVPDDFEVASTGVKREVKSGSGRRDYFFAAGPARDFETQASPDYRVKSRTVGATVVSSYYLGKNAEAGENVLRYGVNALEQYSRHFGPYPYTRLNICEAPLVGGAAGMEFTGQVLIGDFLYGMPGATGTYLPEELENLGEDIGGYLVPRPVNTLAFDRRCIRSCCVPLPRRIHRVGLGRSPCRTGASTLSVRHRIYGTGYLEELGGASEGGFLEDVTAHEVCHQWWALGVGNDAINDPWQDESLTNYCTTLYYKWQYGEEQFQQAIQDDLVYAYTTMREMDVPDAPVDLPVAGYAGDDQYNAIVYGKGALFFYALNSLMGDPAFEKSLSDYYHRYLFLRPSPKELMDCFVENAKNPAEVQALYVRWIKETHGDADIKGMERQPAPDSGAIEDLMQRLKNMGIDPEKIKEMLKELLETGSFPFPWDTDNPPLPIPEKSSPLPGMQPLPV